jgi:hypothetical protein
MCTRSLYLLISTLFAASAFASTAFVAPYAGGACSDSASLGATATCYATNDFGTFGGLAQAEGGSGSLHASASSSYLGVTPLPTQNAFGGASYSDAAITDTLFLHGAPSTGFLRFNLALDGSLTLIEDFADPTAFVSALLEVGIGSPGQAAPISFSGNLAFVSGTNSIDLPYSGSSPQIFVDLVLNATCENGQGPKPGNCIAIADFSNTGTVEGIGILDSNHQIVPTATFTSASGYSYPPLAASVPEPNTFGLTFAAGSVLVAIGRIRRKRPL